LAMLNKIIKLSPKNNLTSLMKRWVKGGRYDYSADATLTSRKHMNVQSCIDRWFRLWRVAGYPSGQMQPELDGKEIFELGCGPLLGFGPLTLFLGAKSFRYLEPAYDPKVMASEEIKALYFLPLFDELVANFGKRMSRDAFLDKLKSSSHAVPASASIDLIISVSVLEHINNEDFLPTMQMLSNSGRTGARFLHAVDFGCHGKGGAKTTFGEIYQQSDQSSVYKWGINGLRRCDVARVLLASGMKIVEPVIYRTCPVNRENISTYWTKYTDLDLTARVVLYSGTI